MNKLIPLLVFICFSIQVFSQRSALSPTIRKLKNDTIIWKQDSLLRHTDFKARGKSNGPLGFANVGMLIYTGESDGELMFYVEALFMKSKSYINKNTDYVLKHEQLHFDICELYARMLRKKLSETNFKKIKSLQKEMQNQYVKFSEQLIKEEDKYDNDTEHGLNSAKQKLWEEDILNRLNELKTYSDTAVNIAQS